MNWMLMPFRRYADFRGRSRRAEFWMFALLNILVTVVLMSAFLSGDMLADPAAAMENPSMTITLAMSLLGIWWLVALIPNIAVTVRRLHDRDMSGWWYLGAIVANFIPVVSLIAAIALFVVLVLPGTPGSNRFGPNPLDPSDSEVFA